MMGKGGRSFSFKRLAIGLVLIAAVLVAFNYFSNRGSAPPEGLVELQIDFIEILPDELSDEQIREIESILILYNRRIELGEVARRDQIAISGKMEEYVRERGIDRRELDQFIALVSFFSYRLDPDHNPEDGSGIHPLLRSEEGDNDDGT